VADPSVHHGADQVFFGATVSYVNSRDEARTVTIKGVDEADSAAGEISWIAPMARALLGARVGDELKVQTPAGVDLVEVLAVTYPGAGAA
jgi:transcription elongation factor GreB